MRLPPNRQIRTEGGTDVVLVDWAGAPLVELRVLLPVLRHGGRDAAAAQVLGRIIPLAPEDAGAAAFDERALRHGASIHGVSGVDRITVSITVPREHLGWALRHIVGRITAPEYHPQAVAEVIRSEHTRLQQTRAHRETALHRLLTEHRWGPGHPYTWSIAHPADLEELTSGELDGFARRSLGLHGATMMIVGDLDSRDGDRWPEVLAPILQTLDGAGAGAGPELPADPGPRAVPPGVVPVPAQESTASLRLWAPAPRRQEEDHVALHLAGVVLGGYFGSRLNQDLRERRGDVYGVSTGFEVLASAASFALMLECPVDRLDGVHARVRETLRDLRTDGPGRDELHAAARYSTNAVTVGMSSPAALCSAGSTVIFGGDRLGMWERHAAQAERLGPEEVAAAAARYLADEALIDLVADPRGPERANLPRREEFGRSIAGRMWVVGIASYRRDIDRNPGPHHNREAQGDTMSTEELIAGYAAYTDAADLAAQSTEAPGVDANTIIPVPPVTTTTPFPPLPLTLAQNC